MKAKKFTDKVLSYSLIILFFFSINSILVSCGPFKYKKTDLRKIPGNAREKQMKNIEEINKASVKKILTTKKIPKFFAGDTIKIGVRIAEGKRARIQYFEGVCIAKKNRDINSSFTVRKISFGEGVERTFALYSPVVASIKVIRSGQVRRSKLYYLRDRKGKSARISEKIKKRIGVDVPVQVDENEIVKEDPKAATPGKEETKKENLIKDKGVVLKAEPKKKKLKKEKK